MSHKEGRWDMDSYRRPGPSNRWSNWPLYAMPAERVKLQVQRAWRIGDPCWHICQQINRRIDRISVISQGFTLPPLYQHPSEPSCNILRSSLNVGPRRLNWRYGCIAWITEANIRKSWTIWRLRILRNYRQIHSRLTVTPSATVGIQNLR
jgi:hypothetical protein